MAMKRPYSAVYRALSAAALCVALMVWARATADLVRIPAVHAPWFGLVLLLAGLTIGLAGARLFPHPVYTGSCISCAGVSIAVGSASGLWLVSPIVALSCTALVLGQGRHNQRTPARVLPQAGTSPPTGMDRLRFYLFVLLPWLALYEVVLAIGIPPDAISGVSRFEQRLPVLEWTQIVYASTYFLTIFAPVFAKTRSDLRRYSMRALWTMLVAYPAFLLIPLIAPKRPFTPQTIPGHLLLWERTLDSPVAAFPSFHVIWAMLAAEVFARRWPRLKGLFYGWAILVAVSCVTTSQHSILDVLGGAATVALVARAPRIGTAARRAIGPAQVMSRGFYAGVAAFLGLWLAETMAGASAQTNTLVAGTWLIVAALSAGAPLARAVDSLRYPAPIYSMCWNGAITLILARLWLLAAPLHIIAGLYFILAGIGRFVEETRRNGPRPRPHRWISIASVLAGASITALARSAPAPAPHLAWTTLLPAVLLGAAVAIAARADFPKPNRRFARIPGVTAGDIFISE